MFELEIILTGYTIVVVASSVVISKSIVKKRLKKISKELSVCKSNVLNVETEIKQIKKTLGNRLE